MIVIIFYLSGGVFVYLSRWPDPDPDELNLKFSLQYIKVSESHLN